MEVNGIRFDNLDDGILEEIFQHLSPLDKIIASYVNRRWARILMKKLDINSELGEKFNSFFKTIYPFPLYINYKIRRLGEYINHLRIENLDYDDDMKYYDEYDYEEFMGPREQKPTFFLLKKVAIHCLNITNLELCGVDYLKDESKESADSSEEDFEELEDDTQEEYLELLFSNNTNIRSLALRSSSINGKSLLKLRPKLIEELDIFECYFSPIEYLLDFLKQLKNLKTFKTCLISYEEICALSNCENISEFSITDCKNFNDLSNLLLKQNELRDLNLNTLSVDEIFLNKLPKVHLEKLEIVFHENLSNYQIHQFENLKILKCRIIKLYDEFIKSLTRCKNLEKLDISIRDYYLTKAGEDSFENLENLKYLNIICTNMEPIADNMLIALSKCKKFFKLEMTYFKISDIGIDCINNNMPNLKYFFSPKIAVIGGKKTASKLTQCFKRFPNKKKKIWMMLD